MKKISSDDIMLRADGYSALSSTYYSIASTGYAQLRAIKNSGWRAFYRFPLWCLTWLPLSTWCYLRMLPLSDRCEKLIGYWRMSADQCDIRQNILRQHKNYSEAEICAGHGLRKIEMKEHTKGLLLVGLADAELRLGKSQSQIESLLLLAIMTANEIAATEIRQAARIYRQCARIMAKLRKNSEAQECLEKSRELAEAIGSKDQILKSM